MELFDFYRGQLAACDAEIGAQLGQFEDKSGSQRPAPALHRPKAGRTTLTFDARQHPQWLTGVDPTRINGIDAPTALKVVAEIGLDMTRWPTEKHFASWLGLAPGSKVRVEQAWHNTCSSSWRRTWSS